MRTREHASPVTTASQTGLTFILILSGLMAFTSLSTDIYLPAMPTMAEDLHGNVELTITGFLIGGRLAIIWGGVSRCLSAWCYLSLVPQGVRCLQASRKLFSGGYFRRLEPVPGLCWRER